MPNYKGVDGRFVTVPLVERFWDKVVKTDGCWYWIGKSDERGYGRIRAGKVSPMAHHILYYLKTGEWVPFGYEADHTCKEPSCVRLGHGHVEIIPEKEHAKRTALTHRNRNKKECDYGHSRWAIRKNGTRYCMDCNLAYHHARKAR
jgi:hypothetical protein